MWCSLQGSLNALQKVCEDCQPELDAEGTAATLSKLLRALMSLFPHPQVRLRYPAHARGSRAGRLPLRRRTCSLWGSRRPSLRISTTLLRCVFVLSCSRVSQPAMRVRSCSPQGLFQLGSDAEPEVRRHVCQALVLLLELCPERVQPFMADIVRVRGVARGPLTRSTCWCARRPSRRWRWRPASSGSPLPRPTSSTPCCRARSPSCCRCCCGACGTRRKRLPPCGYGS